MSRERVLRGETAARASGGTVSVGSSPRWTLGVDGAFGMAGTEEGTIAGAASATSGSRPAKASVSRRVTLLAPLRTLIAGGGRLVTCARSAAASA